MVMVLTIKPNPTKTERKRNGQNGEKPNQPANKKQENDFKASVLSATPPFPISIFKANFGHHHLGKYSQSYLV